LPSLFVDDDLQHSHVSSELVGGAKPTAYYFRERALHCAADSARNTTVLLKRIEQRNSANLVDSNNGHSFEFEIIQAI
jgi:hypothetical protein